MPACSLFSESLQPDPAYQLTATELALKNQQRWTISARLSVRMDNRAWSGSLRWRQSPEDFVFTVYAPLGQGALQLKGDNQAVRFRSADGRDFLAEDLPTMVRDELGFDLPVISLRDWIRGLPARSGGAFIRRGQDQEIRSIKQGEWTVEYRSYQTLAGQIIPRKMRVYNDSYELRIVVYDWRVENDEPVNDNDPAHSGETPAAFQP